MSERDHLLDEIGALGIRLVALGLPEQTSSLLDYDLTLQQLRVFAFIVARGRTPITRIAEALDIRPNVATGIVQRLVDRGLVERQEDPTDRRVRLAAVTERGLALIEELSGIVVAKMREVLGRLNDGQLRQFRDLWVATKLAGEGLPTGAPVGMPGAQHLTTDEGR